MRVGILNCAMNNSNNRPVSNSPSYCYAQKPLAMDSFQRIDKNIAFKRECPAEFLKRDGITTEFVQGLPSGRLSEMTEFAQTNLSEYLRRKVSTNPLDTFLSQTFDFVDEIKASLDEKYGLNNYVFISVGQSPAVLAEILKLRGIETKICPVSKLGDLRNFHEVSENDLNKYAEYMKKIGLDPEEMKKSSKKYIFTDYCELGTSSNTFQKLIAKKGYNIPDVAFFIDLKSLATSPSSCLFLDYYFDIPNLKALSPIFKLPYKHLGQVQAYMDDSNNVNSYFNMFKFLAIKKLLGRE